MSNWVKVAPLEDFKRLGARIVRTQDNEGKTIEIGVFRLEDDRIFAINNSCPHKGGPLSEGIVYGDKIACPMHSWKISLVDGKAEEPDVGQTACFKTRVEAGVVYLELKDKLA
ncbi:MAG: nitrite reductase small subunit NirD [Methylotenera sp.]|nr:nitrite reductase small subunit NirD [Methylotenera sp.]